MDPEGYYARLGIEPSAPPEEVVAAYRRKARTLHPDVPGTGNTDAFVAVKQAYDVLGNVQARSEYDRMARRAALEALEPGEIPPVQRAPMAAAPWRNPRPDDIPVVVWVVLGSILVVGVFEVIRHLLLLPPLPPRPEMRANAPIVAPASPEAQRLAAYGPTPLRLAGTPNFYVVPAAGSTMIWRYEESRKAFVAAGQLPPFSSVQAVRLLRRTAWA